MKTDRRLAKLQESLNLEPYSGRVSSLCIRKDDGIREHPEDLTIDEKKGVLGDRWVWRTWKHLENGDPDPRVQVAICSARILKLLQTETSNDYHPGDNILVDFDLRTPDFSVGNRFQIGTATFEVTDVFNNACAKFAGEFGKEVVKWINHPEHLKLNLRGIYCRVVQSGSVKLGDEIRTH